MDAATKATPTEEQHWLSDHSASRQWMQSVRMGKGKGDPAGWVAPVTPGRILFEVEGVPFDIAKEALRLGAQKLPVKTKFVVRRDFDKNA